jgi:tetratricopeptide (TPR) repeat protein
MKNFFFLLILGTLVFSLFFHSCRGVPPTKPGKEVEQIYRQTAGEVGKEVSSKTYFHYMAAQIKANRGLLDEAIEEYKKAIRYDPQSALLRLELSRLYINKGLMDEAVRECLEAVALEPENVDALLTLGGLYSAENKTDLAAEHYKKVLSIDPQNRHAFRYLSDLYYSTNEYEKAIKLLNRFVKVEPRSVLGYYYLGRIYAEMEKWDEAEANYLKALEIDPSFVSALNDLATLYAFTKRPEKAITFFNQVLEVDPHNKRARTGLGQIYMRNKQLDEAIHQFQEIQKVDEDNLNIRLMLAMMPLSSFDLSLLPNQTIIGFVTILHRLILSKRSSHRPWRSLERYLLSPTYMSMPGKAWATSSGDRTEFLRPWRRSKRPSRRSQRRRSSTPICLHCTKGRRSFQPLLGPLKKPAIWNLKTLRFSSRWALSMTSRAISRKQLK